MRAAHPVSPSLVINPLAAYARDLQGRQGASTLGSADAAWLELGIGLHRLARLDPDARDAYMEGLESSGSDVRSLLVQLTRGHDEARRQDALSVLHDIVEGMENHHAFHLAFASLSATRRALPDLSPLLTGRLMAQQARVARQLGDLETAADLYEMVLDLGKLHDEPELLVRGHVGAGLVAESRGNFPAARSEYQRALAHGETVPRVAAIAHHGLMVAASKAGDLATALQHAWAAFEGVAGDTVRRVDLLINLAELARKAGAARVALRAFRTALGHAELSRLRLPALSGAAHAAAALGDRSTVLSLAEQAEHEAAASGIPYENAKLWRELAEAFVVLDDTGRAAEYARRAGQIADSHAFHEQGVKAADLVENMASRGARKSIEQSDVAAHDILRRLDALADAGGAAIVG